MSKVNLVSSKSAFSHLLKKKKKEKSAFSLKNKYLFIYLKSLFLEDILKSLHVPFPKNKIK